MKVRHKSGLELEVFRQDHAMYFETKGGTLIYADDPDWQLVPEEKWEDVTHEYKIFFPISFPDEQDMSLKTIKLRHDENLVYNDGLHNGPHITIKRRKER